VTGKVLSGTVSLSWTASSDNVGVTGYQVSRVSSNGTVATTWTTTSRTLTESGVPTGTWSYKVRAADAAGNLSPVATTTVTVPAPSIVTVTSVNDTVLSQTAPTTNYFQAAALGIKGGTTDAQAALLRFTLPAAPAGTQITSVTLRMMTGSSSASKSAASFDVRLASDTWVASSVTWNTKPSITGTRVGSFTAPCANNTWYAAALTPSAVAATRTASGNVSLAVTSTGADYWGIYSNDYTVTTYWPQLVVTFG
jgi:hypothetical protein